MYTNVCASELSVCICLCVCGCVCAHVSSCVYVLCLDLSTCRLMVACGHGRREESRPLWAVGGCPHDSWMSGEASTWPPGLQGLKSPPSSSTPHRVNHCHLGSMQRIQLPSPSLWKKWETDQSSDHCWGSSVAETQHKLWALLFCFVHPLLSPVLAEMRE